MQCLVSSLKAPFSNVCAYDYSEGFVENMKARAEEMGVKNLSGRQGDSHCQEEMYPGTKFDLIFGCNLIDRLHSPSSWVTQSKVRRGFPRKMSHIFKV